MDDQTMVNNLKDVDDKGEDVAEEEDEHHAKQHHCQACEEYLNS